MQKLESSYKIAMINHFQKKNAVFILMMNYFPKKQCCIYFREWKDCYWTKRSPLSTNVYRGMTPE
jgi:hypothetical protein